MVEKYNEQSERERLAEIIKDRKELKFTSQDVGKEVVKLIKRMTANNQTVDFMRFLKKKYNG